MTMVDDSDDRRAIEAIVGRQFASLNWRPGTSGDWQAFASDFHSNAALYPASRPAKPQTVSAFIERMKGLSGGTLRSFGERVLGTDIRIFGNVAMALAACEITENEEKTIRGVEAMLLVKDGGVWTIVAQSWDTERDGVTVPDDLLGNGSSSG